MTKNLLLGLDIGIASIGWSLFEKDLDNEIKRMIDLGVVTFQQLEDKDGKLENEQRRNKRSLRRQRRRKTRRKEDTKELFKKYLEFDYDNFIKKSKLNPYELKIKGLKSKLTTEEFSVVLLHYMKYRGFQSTRKVEDKKSEGVILSKIEEIKSQLVDKTITEVILEKFNSKSNDEKRIHNSPTEYLFTFSREMYLDEIEKIFKKQIELKNCNDIFKDEYLKIYNRRRDFSEGPGKGSKFGSEGSFIEKMIGLCKYDNNLRAPRESYSSQAFTLLSFLNNFRFKAFETDKRYENRLSKEQIKKVFEFAITKSEIKYSDIIKIAKIECFRIKGLELSRKQYINVKNKYIEKEKITNKAYDFISDVKFKEFQKNELFSSKLNVSMKFTYTLNKYFDSYLKENKDDTSIAEFKKDLNNYDIVSYCLLINKTDIKVENYLKSMGFDQHIINVVSTLPSISQTINLSKEICNALIPYLLDGNDYESSMKLIGYNIQDVRIVEKTTFLPEINEALNNLNVVLTNVNVKHTLVQVRKLINEVIKKYGEIDTYSIEFARELKKSHLDRRKMNFDMIDNKSTNDNIKIEIINKYSNVFKSLSSIKKDDLIKYKLFKEQNFMCGYTAEQIKEKDLFDNNIYQIDHILPYSRSYDDSYTNKILVTTKANQLKGNKLPKEAFNKEEFENILKVIKNSNIGYKKRDNLLASEIEEDFLTRNLNDTSYIARLTRDLIKSYLQPTKCMTPSGSVTNKLKYMWKLNGLTHSYLNENYRNRNTFILTNYLITSTSIKLDFNIKEINQEESFEISIKNLGKEKNQTEKSTNDIITFFDSNSSLLEVVLNKYIQKSISILFNEYSYDTSDINKQIFNDNLIIFNSFIKSFVELSRNKKDRNNHLHHAIDAAITACSTDKLIKRVTSYFMDEEKNMVVNEYGEITHNFDLFPKPYNDFRDEVMIRVYERDKLILLNKLNDLSIYNNTLERKDVKVLLPVKIKDKYKSGALTSETIYGMKFDLSSGKNVITKRINVNLLDEKKIEKIVGSTKQNPIKEACMSWIENKKPTKFPYHPTRNNPIKSVLIEETDNLLSRVKIKENENRFASNAKCISVNVYKKENDEKLYFVPIYYYQTITKNKDNIVYQIMWGQGKNIDFIKGSKLNSEYTLLHTLPRYSLIEVTLTNGATGLCYSGGASSGLYEIYSVLGDALDLVRYNLTGKIRAQYQITVSTIKSIKVRSLSILGDLN